MSQSGIVIKSERRDDDFCNECITCLEVYMGETDQITDVLPFECGLKVYFKDTSSLEHILKFDRCIWVWNTKYMIYPLTTQLTVHAESKLSDELEHHIRNQLQKILGSVLEMTKVPLSKKNPLIATGKLRVVIDIPEIEDQEVFKNAGLPDQMTVLSSSGENKYKVSFYCSECNTDGHLPSNCPKYVEKKQVPQVQTKFRVKAESPEQKLQNSTESFASVLGEEVVRKYSQHVKTEPDSAISSKRLNNSVEETHKKLRTSYGKMGSSADCKNMPSTSSSILFEDDEVRILDPKKYSTVASRRSPNDAFKNSSEDSGQVSTSGFLSDQDPRNPDIKSEQEGEHTTPVIPRNRRTRKPAKLLPVVIPDRIKTLIDGRTNNIMDSNKLQAFLNHVKKKSSPATVAQEYTDNVQGFLQQLKDVKDQYYNQPDMGTPQERSFMKDFGNLVARFNNKAKPRTPKNKRNNPDDGNN